MIFLSAEAVDAAWQLIANEVVNRKLANDCKVFTAKQRKPEKMPSKKPVMRNSDEKKEGVDTKKPKSDVPEDGHVICVYVANFDELGAVFEVRKRLFDIGFQQKLQFKLSAYSFCGIYTGNRWGISTSTYRR